MEGSCCCEGVVMLCRSLDVVKGSCVEKGSCVVKGSCHCEGVVLL